MRIRLRRILWSGIVISSLFLSQPGAGADPPKRVLYMTHSAGYVHDSIPTSCDVMQALAARSGQFEVICSEDLSLIAADSLRNFDVLYFFTSGELELSDQQKADLLDFVRSGKGFGGVHSATDTLYTWPEYGDLIGAYFNGHPWAQEVSINIEDPDDPAVRALAPSFRIVDEIYQFRNFSRDRAHVLMSLDTTSVDLTAPEVARDDGDFPLAWRRTYGQGRVFYTALGHFSETWLDERFQTMLLNALVWLGAETGN
jgi:type 1 glutamine amidotransferase